MVPCDNGAMTFLQIWTWILLVDLICIKGMASDDGKCSVNPQSRLQCTDIGVTEDTCTQYGCCYHKDYGMCYFPVLCEKVITIAGGGSAFMVLPGEDRPGRGSMSMLDGGHWCGRDSVPKADTFQLELDLGRRRLVHIIMGHVVTAPFVFPFNISYTFKRHKWKLFEESMNSSTQRDSSHLTFVAHRINIRPRTGESTSCTTIDVISCPAPPVEETPNVTNIVPTESPEIKSAMKVQADERPSAIFVGSLGIIMMVSVLAVIIILDIPSLTNDFAICYKNIRSFCRYYNINCRILTSARPCVSCQLCSTCKHRPCCHRNTCTFNNGNTGCHSNRRSLCLGAQCCHCCLPKGKPAKNIKRLNGREEFGNHFHKENEENGSVSGSDSSSTEEKSCLVLESNV